MAQEYPKPYLMCMDGQDVTKTISRKNRSTTACKISSLDEMNTLDGLSSPFSSSHDDISSRKSHDESCSDEKSDTKETSLESTDLDNHESRETKHENIIILSNPYLDLTLVKDKGNLKQENGTCIKDALLGEASSPVREKKTVRFDKSCKPCREHRTRSINRKGHKITKKEEPDNMNFFEKARNKVTQSLNKLVGKSPPKHKPSASPVKDNKRRLHSFRPTSNTFLISRIEEWNQQNVDKTRTSGGVLASGKVKQPVGASTIPPEYEWPTYYESKYS